MTPAIAILFAIDEEVRPLLRECTIREKIEKRPACLYRTQWKGQPLLLCRTGLGLANAHEGAEFLLEHSKPTIMISAGYAGAASPTLKTGDLVIATEIRSETPSDRFFPDSDYQKLVEEALRQEKIDYHTGPLLTRWKLAGVTAKRESHENSITHLDMETAAVAAIAKKARLPFFSLRVIFDEYDEELPFDQNENGETNPISFLIKNPKAILKIPKYFRMNRRCQRNLAQAIQSLINLDRT